jgi:conjugal transfer pilus assembly protein TraW
VRTFYFDPSFTLDRNILGRPGPNCCLPAGTRKNPLEIVSLSQASAVFRRTRCASGRASARALMANYQGRVKPILTGGSYLELMQSWHVPVYYDQLGMLTRRLGITQVPALVSQDGLRLRVDRRMEMCTMMTCPSRYSSS